MNAGKVIGGAAVVGGSIWLFLLFFHLVTFVALGVVAAGAITYKASSSNRAIGSSTVKSLLK